MSKWMEFGVGAKSVPVELVVNDRFGGVPGEPAKLQIRRVPDGWYLDFADQKFKNSGHVTPIMSIAEAGGGRYRYIWDSSVAITSPTVVTVHFDNVDGTAPGIDDDHITFSNSAAILERLSKTPSASVGDGPGNCVFQYLLTKENSAAPISGVTVYVTSDLGGSTIIAGPKLTDTYGKVIFYLNKNTQYYFWRSKGGFTFVNPDLQSF